MNYMENNEKIEDVVCIILNYNDAVNSVQIAEKVCNYNFISKVIIVDNCSNDDSLSVLKNMKFGKIDVCETGRNGGYGYGNNYGVKYAKSHYGAKYALIINPDVDFGNDLVAELRKAFFINSNVAIVSAIQLDKNYKRIKGIAWRLPKTWQYVLSTSILLNKIMKSSDYDYDALKHKYCEVDCVPGSLLMVDIAKFLTFGGYDEQMFLYCEETTIGYKCKRKGYRTILIRDLEYVHLHSVSISKSISKEVDRRRLLLESRLYFLKNYYLINKFQEYLTKAFFKYSLLEYLIIRKIITSK